MKDSQKDYKNPCAFGKRKEVASIERWPREWEKNKKKNPCLIRSRTVALIGGMEKEESNPEEEREAKARKSEKDAVYENPCILRTKTPGIVGKLDKNKD